MAQDQTLTSSARNPALEQLIESGLECLNQAENTSEDWLYDLYIADARKEFRKAVEIAPDEPWLWFQIGWLNLMDNDEIDDPDPIRTALQRALELDPDLVTAHVALAYLEAKVSDAHQIYIEQVLDEQILEYATSTGERIKVLKTQMTESEDPATVSACQTQIDELDAELRRTFEGPLHQLHQAIWTGPSGEHLRAARERNWDELFEGIDVTIPGTDIVIEYYPCVIGNLRVIDMLDGLGEYLPTSKRASFYHLIGMGFCNGSIRPAGATWFEYDIKWFEKAARWADMVTDHWELFSLFTHLSGAYQEMKPPDGSFAHFKCKLTQ